jgi:hypothetical protein
VDDRDVRYLPVPAGGTLEASPRRPIERAQAAASPATVAAAGGFLAGIATFVVARLLTRRHGRGALSRALPGRRRRGAIEVAGSRSFLVDVHMLRR